jgi:outer membrane protein TolC
MNRLVPRCSLFVLSSALLALLCSSPAEAQEPVRSSSLEEDIRAIEELSGLDNEASSLSLDDALKSALSENLGLRVAVRNLSAARSRLKASWAPFMPFATGSWGYQPSKTERWFDQYETWERTEGHTANYSFGVGASLPTGTSLTANWSQGEFSRATSYDPEVFVNNPLAPDDPIPLLADNEFQTKWSALSFTLNQSLLQGISPRYQMRAVDQARVAVDRIELEEGKQIASVASNVLKAYWDLVAARRLVEIQRIDRRLAEEQRIVTAARVRVGELASVELLRIDETVATRQVELLEAERSAAEAEQRLKLLMGVKMSDELYGQALRPGDGIAGNLPSRDRATSLDVALAGNPDLLIARQDLASRKIDWKAAKHELLPDLGLAATLNLNGSGFDHKESVDDVFARKFPDFQVGMNLSVPLPDVGAIHSVRAADQEVQASLLSLEIAEMEVLSGVETSLRSIESFGAQVSVARVRVDLAARTAEASQATFEAGRNTLREVLEAQAALKEARVSLVQAEVEQLKARVDLELLRGSLLETLGVEKL